VNSDNDLISQPNTIQQKPKSSPKSVKPLSLFAAILIVTFLVGIGGYFLTIKTKQNASRKIQKTSFNFKQSPTDTFLKRTANPVLSVPSPSGDLPQREGFHPGHWCDPSNRLSTATPTLMIYRNEKLGFELMYEEGIYVMKETPDKVSLGFTYPILRISTS
jgi:hypothetical protein